MSGLPDIHEEADRLLSLADAREVPMRLLGGLAVARHLSPELTSVLGRTTADIDLATVRGRSSSVSDLLLEAGYDPDRALNALNGRRRLLFYDDANQRKVDVFIGSFEMCHPIALDRIGLIPGTIPLAELMLTKLQIVELNEKDLRDLLALLSSQPLTDDEEGINVGVIAGALADDWGLWRTTRDNLDHIRDRVRDYRLPEAAQLRVLAACDRLWEAVEAEPKSRAWRLRARIGERKRWYQTPEEVG